MSENPAPVQVHAEAGSAVFRHSCAGQGDHLLVLSWGAGYPALEAPACRHCGEAYALDLEEAGSQDPRAGQLAEADYIEREAQVRLAREQALAEAPAQQSLEERIEARRRELAEPPE